MAISLLGIFVGVAIAFFHDVYSWRKYGYPSLSILIAKVKYGSNFKWLACNVWGNDDWYYKRVYQKTRKA